MSFGGSEDDIYNEDDGGWDEDSCGGEGEVEKMKLKHEILVAERWAWRRRRRTWGEEKKMERIQGKRREKAEIKRGSRTAEVLKFFFWWVNDKRAWAEIFLARSSFLTLLHLFPATCLSYSMPWNEAFLIILPLSI